MVSRYDGATLRHITDEDGLVGNIVDVMLKDKEGNVWFASGFGLTKYDGKEFQHLGGNAEVEWDGDEWQTEASTPFIKLNDRKSKIVWKDRGRVGYWVSEFLRVTAIFEDSKGDIWLGGRSKPYLVDVPFLIQYDGIKFHRFNLELPPEISKQATIRAIAEDDAGNLWFGGRYTLLRYDGKEFERFDQKPKTVAIEFQFPEVKTLVLGT